MTAKEHREARRARGQCMRCPEPALPGMTHCQTCLDERKPIHHQARPSTKGHKRPCLRCDAVFLSEGPFNKVCGACRQIVTYGPTPATEYRLVIPRRS